MLNIYTIATAASRIADLCKCKELKQFEPVYQARPAMQLPVIVQDKDRYKLVMGRWGLAR